MSARNTSSRSSVRCADDMARRGQRREFRHRAFAAHAPAAEQHEAVAEARGIADLMNREEQRPPAGRVRAQGGGNVARLAQVEALERLVDEQRRLGRQQADGQQDALALAFRERADGLVQQLAQIELLHDFVAKRRLAAEKTDREIERPSHRTARATGRCRREHRTGANGARARRPAGRRRASCRCRTATLRPGIRTAWTCRRRSGPMSPSTSPARTWKLTSARAVTRPNRLERPLTSNNMGNH